MMHPRRIEALANYLETVVQEQKAEGNTLFTIASDDKINMQDADAIVAALKAHAQPQEIDPARAAWLWQLQIENDCNAFREVRLGKPCHSHKCGCALEMQNFIDAFSSRSTEPKE